MELFPEFGDAYLLSGVPAPVYVPTEQGNEHHWLSTRGLGFLGATLSRFPFSWSFPLILEGSDLLTIPLQWGKFLEDVERYSLQGLLYDYLSGGLNTDDDGFFCGGYVFL